MTIISATYEMRELALIQKESKNFEVWKDYPVRLLDSEKDAIKLDVVVSVLEGADCSPASLAGIKTDQIASFLLVNIVEEYKKAISHYKLLLFEATQKDLASIEENKQYRIREDYHGFWWIWAIFGCSFIDREKCNRDAQARRYKWCVEVSILEDIRLKKIKNQIENAMPQLVEQLEEMKMKNQRDIKLCMKAWQLQKVYSVLFPDSKLNQRDSLYRLLPGEELMNDELQLYKGD